MPIFQNKMKKNVKVMKVLKYVPNFLLQEWKCSEKCSVVCCICYRQDTFSWAALSCCFKHNFLAIIVTRQCLSDKRSARLTHMKKPVDLELLQLKNCVVYMRVCMFVWHTQIDCILNFSLLYNELALHLWEPNCCIVRCVSVSNVL